MAALGLGEPDYSTYGLVSKNVPDSRSRLGAPLAVAFHPLALTRELDADDPDTVADRPSAKIRSETSNPPGSCSSEPGLGGQAEQESRC